MDADLIRGSRKMMGKRILLAVNGTLMRGLKLNGNMVKAQAEFVRETTTEASYRCWSIDDDHPGMIKTLDKAKGAAIAVEVWSVPASQLAELLISEPEGLCIGKVRLSDGSVVLGVLAEPWVVFNQREITQYAGWRNYVGDE